MIGALAALSRAQRVLASNHEGCTASIESMATATRNVNAVDIENPDDLDKFVQDLMSSMVRLSFFLFGLLCFVLPFHH